MGHGEQDNGEAGGYHVIDILAKGIFVTNNFHVLRASLYARKVGLIATGRGSNTALYYVPNAFMREFVGLLEMTKWLHISLLTLFTIGWFIVMTGYL